MQEYHNIQQSIWFRKKSNTWTFEKVTKGILNSFNIVSIAIIEQLELIEKKKYKLQSQFSTNSRFYENCLLCEIYLNIIFKLISGRWLPDNSASSQSQMCKGWSRFQ